MKATIHCGTYKTGSTAIQNTAYYNQDSLREQGVIYPNAGIDINAQKDGGEIGFRHARFVYEYNKNTYGSLKAQLEKEVSDKTCSQVFISSEAWSRPDTIVSLNAIVKYLKKIGFTEVNGIVFIRNVKEYMVSHYREWVRRYGTSSNFENYVISKKYYFDYLTIFNNIKKAFEGNVDFISYENINDVNRFTFEKLGVDYDNLKLPNKTNKGISCLDTEVIRLLNQYGLRIKNLPSSDELLGHFGLQVQKKGFSEKLPYGFTEVFDNKYIKDFSSLTEINFSDSKRLFSNRENLGFDISTISPLLEKAVLEWLKSKKASTFG
ncbi:hypothetical protein R3F72_17310 [Salinicola sp. 4072]|uniref:hypothetical protein n=2 Tax=Salinicola sp. 4072 TaxID=3082157 RepID=UPI002FCC435C